LHRLFQKSEVLAISEWRIDNRVARRNWQCCSHS